MPRASNGTYTLPPGTIVATGDTILPSQHNPAMTDIAAALTDSIPKTGGTFTGAVSFPAGITGPVTFASGVVAASLSTAGTLSVGGAATFSNNATVSGNFRANGTVTFPQSVTINGGLIGNTLNLTGAAAMPSLTVANGLSVGGTISTPFLQVNGTTNSSGDAFYAGNVSAAAFIPTSDRRLKSEIYDLDGAAMLDAIRLVGGKQYVKNGSPELGVIAQDVQAAGLLSAVVANDRDGMLGVNYNALVGVLFAAVSYLADEVDRLKPTTEGA